MNKKLVFAFIGAVLLAFVIGGTVAYFTLEFSSENTATAATFDVDVVNSEGQTIGDGQFNLGQDLYPGMEPLEAYHFSIEKNNTDLPVEYQVDLIASGELFPEDGSSPVVLTLERNVDGEWTEVDHSSTFTPTSDSEDYRIIVTWPHGENDIDFQGLTGNINLEVVATQVDGEGGDNGEGEPLYTGEIEWKSSGFDWNHHFTSNQEIEFSESNGLKTVQIYVTEDDNFIKEVGDFSINEYEQGLYRVVSDTDPHTMPNGGWIVEDSTIDTSTDGVVIFNKRDRPDRYISIESSELHDFFTN